MNHAVLGHLSGTWVQGDFFCEFQKYSSLLKVKPISNNISERLLTFCAITVVLIIFNDALKCPVIVLVIFRQPLPGTSEALSYTNKKLANYMEYYTDWAGTSFSDFIAFLADGKTR